MSVQPFPLGDDARPAQDRLREVERRLTVVRDDSAPIFGAMAEFADAMAQSKLDAEAHREELTKIVQSIKQPVKADEALQRAVIQGISSYARPIIQAINNRNSLVGTLALTGALVVGGGLGYWLHWRITPTPPELTCRDERGGRVCFAWASPPTEPLEPQQAAPAGQQQPVAKPAITTNGKR